MRLFAIDSTSVVDKRLQIAWYQEITLNGYLPAIEEHYNSCLYHPPNTTTNNNNNNNNNNHDNNGDVAQVTVIGNTVIATVNYKTIINSNAVSLNDTGRTTYTVSCGESSDNEVVVTLGSFQSDNTLTDFKSDYVIKATQPSIAINSDLSTKLFVINLLLKLLTYRYYYSMVKTLSG